MARKKRNKIHESKLIIYEEMFNKEEEKVIVINKINEFIENRILSEKTAEYFIKGILTEVNSVNEVISPNMINEEVLNKISDIVLSKLQISSTSMITLNNVNEVEAVEKESFNEKIEQITTNIGFKESVVEEKNEEVIEEVREELEEELEETKNLLSNIGL